MRSASARASTHRFNSSAASDPNAPLSSPPLGIKTVDDLLHHLPFRYEDRRQIKKISAAVQGEEASFIGRLIGLQSKYIPRRRSQMLLGILQDDTGSMDLVWYRAPKFLISGLAKDQTLLVHGKLEPSMHGRLRLVHPDFEIIENNDDPRLQRILPVYVRPGGPVAFSIARLDGASTERIRRLSARESASRDHRADKNSSLPAQLSHIFTIHRSMHLSMS